MKQSRIFLLFGLAIRHALQDTALGVIPILLAARSGELHLSNAQIGLGPLLYQTASSISQPMFGHLSDRRGLTWLPTAAVMWTSLLVGLAGLAQSYLLIAMLIALAGLGSGAFHPQSAAQATATGGDNRQATAASLFFLGGTFGQALVGSALGGAFISLLGSQGLLLLTALVWAVALFLYRWTRVNRSAKGKAPSPQGPGANSMQVVPWFGLTVFLLAIAVRAVSRQGFVNYIPKLYQDWDYSPATYGLMLSFYLLGGALGGVAGSYLADRLGAKRVLVISLLITAPLTLGFLFAGGTWAYVLIFCAGLFSGPSHTLLVVAGQRMLAGRAALASGLVLGFTFLSGSVFSWVAGLVADHLGLYLILQGVALLPAIAAILCYVALTAFERSRRAARGSTG